jgi:hypothetical protein
VHDNTCAEINGHTYRDISSLIRLINIGGINGMTGVMWASNDMWYIIRGYELNA